MNTACILIKNLTTISPKSFKIKLKGDVTTTALGDLLIGKASDGGYKRLAVSTGGANQLLQINSSGNDIFKYQTSSINYRIADATRVDKNNRFWAINYFFPRDRGVLKPGDDILASKYGEGLTHSKSERVERLVEYKIHNKKVLITNNPPIEIKLEGEKISRKWEAIARYEKKGFLLATDKYPKPHTLLAYIPIK